MSGTSTSDSNGTTVIAGPNVIQVQDLYVSAGILHPITVGSIAVILLFSYLRLGSNRSIAPITVFDWVIDVALGSTLAGIVNGNSLVRGLLALFTMLGFQYITSTVSSRFPKIAWLFQGPPLVIAFRGARLSHVMKIHRIATADVDAALRQKGVLNISQVDTVIIEPNGSISVFTTKELDDADVEPSVLLAVPAYKALCEQAAKEKRDGESGKGRDKEEASAGQNSSAMDAC